MTLASLLSLLMAVLKTAEFIDWSWWIVWSPMIVVASFWLIVMATSGFLLRKYAAL